MLQPRTRHCASTYNLCLRSVFFRAAARLFGCAFPSGSPAVTTTSSTTSAAGLDAAASKAPLRIPCCSQHSAAAHRPPISLCVLFFSVQQAARSAVLSGFTYGVASMLQPAQRRCAFHAAASKAPLRITIQSCLTFCSFPCSRQPDRLCFPVSHTALRHQNGVPKRRHRKRRHAIIYFLG